jgi:hypothetical protein
MAFLDVLGQRLNGPLTPTVGLDLPTDLLADRAVEVDQLRVDGSNGPHPRCIDQPEHDVEVAR